MPCHGSEQISKFHGGGSGNDTEATLNPPIWNTVICGSIFRYARACFRANIRVKKNKKKEEKNILNEKNVKKTLDLKIKISYKYLSKNNIQCNYKKVTYTLQF